MIAVPDLGRLFCIRYFLLNQFYASLSLSKRYTKDKAKMTFQLNDTATTDQERAYTHFWSFGVLYIFKR